MIFPWSYSHRTRTKTPFLLLSLLLRMGPIMILPVSVAATPWGNFP